MLAYEQAERDQRGILKYRQLLKTAGMCKHFTEEPIMLWTIVVILIVLWLLGLAANVAGGVIHLLLVVALIVVAVNFIQGRRTV